jgi:ribosome-associated protein
MTEPEAYKSRTQKKNEVTALQKLGKKLVSLPKSQILKMGLSKLLEQALLDAKTITKNEAKRRQFQYIGRLMRDVDEKAIEDFLSYRDQGQIKDQVRNKQIETWVENLNPNDNQAIEDLLNQNPHLDRQKFRQLIRNFSNANEKNKSKARKKLVTFLK